jgi:hypothetical protein
MNRISRVTFKAGLALTNQTKLLLVGDGDTIRRLPEVLSKATLEIQVCSYTNSVLGRSKFVSEFFPILLHASEGDWQEKNSKFLKFLEDSDFGFYVFDSDSLIRKVRDSHISQAAKERILPIKDSRLFDLIDSKIALWKFCVEEEVPFPSSEAFDTIKSFARTLGNRDKSIVVKADRGHGGSGTVIGHPENDFSIELINELTEPILVQEYLKQPLVAVEALFIGGVLVGWLHSIPVQSIGPTGPSTKRIFCKPESSDFVESLEKIGRTAKLHGFFNTSWFFDRGKAIHILFELDARPNAWHQFGPKLGVDWSDLIVDTRSVTDSSSLQTAEVQPISLFPRSLIHGLRTSNLRTILSWTFRRRGTWDFANQKDEDLNFVEKKMVLDFWRKPARDFAFRFWGRLPGCIQNSIWIKSALRRLAQSLHL